MLKSKKKVAKPPMTPQEKAALDHLLANGWELPWVSQAAIQAAMNQLAQKQK